MKSFFKVLLVFLIFAALPARAEEPVYNIENITGDLYRFQSDDHYGVFLVTDEGILLVDPINTATATWLKGEFETRFDKTVKVIAYSHHHADHISGAEVFLDTVEVVIAQEAAKPLIEEGGYTVPPTHTFSTGTYVELGGKRVNFYFLYAPHSNNLAPIYFVDEKAIFLADIFYVNSVYWPDFEKTYISSSTTYIQKLVENLEIEIALPSHGKWGTVDDLLHYKNFISTLNQEVSSQMIAGKTLEEIQNQPVSTNLEAFPEYLEILPLATPHPADLPNLSCSAPELSGHPDRPALPRAKDRLDAPPRKHRP